jgi:acyl-CoA synthetase (AMP-forming)/AMP-acid ligase II
VPSPGFAHHESTLAHNLAGRADRHGDQIAVAFTAGDDRWQRLTYAELAARAAAAGDLLRGVRRVGQRQQFVLIMLPNGPDYVVCLYACMLAGAVAVPFYPPASATGRSARAFGGRLREIWANCQPSVVIAPTDLTDFVAAELQASPGPAPVVLAAASLPSVAETAGGIHRIDCRPGDLALLQYTSGSTREPKGVMITHANLAHNVHAFATSLGSAEGESIATWLPLFHDLGLIGTLLHPLAAGMTVCLTTPTAFARRPFLWLDMASRSQATIIMAPNFAFDLCVRWVTEEQRASLDLSHLRVALNGAEPVRHTTIEAFVKAYERYGFRPSATVPGYGLAESTVTVAMSDWRTEPARLEVSEARLRRDGVAVPADHEPARVLVGCGPDVADTTTIIVDPVRLAACPAGTVGEIWVTGPSVAAGYWNLPAVSGQVFTAELADDGRDFLRTGDLGVKIDDELYIVGRINDMIIQRGVNHSPQDIEFTAEHAHPAVRAGGSAVFTVSAGNDEELVVLCELDRYGNGIDHSAIMTAVRAAVVEAHGLEVGTVALLRKGQVPKTTSGKVRRGLSGEKWLAGDFDRLAVWSATR